MAKKKKKSKYTIVDLEQGTQEWLDWRKEGIGASDAPIIMEENPWKSVEDLIKDKRGAKTKNYLNAAMRRGIALEPSARAAYIEETGIKVKPACLQSIEYEWMRASVDGIGADGGTVVEIKCGRSAFEKTCFEGEPPYYYYGQLQHILSVTGLDTIDFWCYLPERGGVLVEVERDDRYIKELLESEKEFWEIVEKG